MREHWWLQLKISTAIDKAPSSPRSLLESETGRRGSPLAMPLSSARRYVYSPLSPVVWARTNQPPKQRAWTRKRPLSTNKHTQKKAPTY